MIRNIIITRRAPAYGGRSFGTSGPYELLDAVVEGALDPADPAHTGIVDLDLAPRDGEGRVAYKCDLVILRPTDAARGNGWLLYDVVNRGLERILSRVNGVAVTRRPGTGDDAGDGLLMRQGYTLVWSGWQPDVPATGGNLTADYPIATENGVPISGPSREEWVDTGTADPFHAPLTYPAADTDPAKATLTVRNREADPRATPDDLTWSYIDKMTVRINRPAGFDSGSIYEFIYPATNSPVAGMAFAAVRDVVSFLRFEPGENNPLADAQLRRAMLFGVSQSGRFVRDYLWQGYNQDTESRKIFDAAMVVVAGSRKTFVNDRFAQPGRFSRQHEDHSFPGDQFPFAYAPVRDPISGETDDILRRCREQGTVPHLMHFDTESELWSARASLLIDDGAGGDLAIPDNVRLYIAAGMPHAPGLPPFPDMTQQAANPMNYAVLLRPLVGALKNWVDDGSPPPDSRFPNFGDDTLMTLDALRESFPAIAGAATPDCLNRLARLDHTQLPPAYGETWPVYVSRTDPVGNPTAGILHPFVEVPLGSFTGWNLRATGHGENDLCSVYGALLPFAVNEAERRAKGDPRPSLKTRYGDHDGYRKLIAQAVARMIDQGYLLEEDGAEILALSDDM
ncbi:MAG: alpha/beta hydrolase domain-containing protein, partial [Alphaproteobacteria bacterium]|nr:alpha/beta hydrolase domain-containing protein [Alphaproteobacteria bacterium]